MLKKAAYQIQKLQVYEEIQQFDIDPMNHYLNNIDPMNHYLNVWIHFFKIMTTHNNIIITPLTSSFVVSASIIMIL